MTYLDDGKERLERQLKDAGKERPNLASRRYSKALDDADDERKGYK